MYSPRDILHQSGPSKITFLIDEAFLQPNHIIWKSVTSAFPVNKYVDKKYRVQLKGAEYLYVFSALSSGHTRSMPRRKELRCLHLLGKRDYSAKL